MKFAFYNLATQMLGRPMEMDFRLLTRMVPVGLTLDVGGNWGQSIYALQRTVRRKRIVSLEPNPLLAARLGLELKLIQGAREAVAATKPVVIVETLPPDVVTELSEFGLMPFSYHGDRLC
jgi:hypothetical protein